MKFLNKIHQKINQVTLKSILSDESGIKKNISINEIPYENFNIEQLQKIIGFAPQEMNFFDGTISENISFGQANEKALIECSKIAGCYDFIVKKKDGFNSKISEEDKKLSSMKLARTMPQGWVWGGDEFARYKTAGIELSKEKLLTEGPICR